MSVSPLSAASNALFANYDRAARADAAVSAAPPVGGGRERIATAVVYCEANFGAIDRKKEMI